MTERAPVTYREAGVDIDAGEELVERIKPHVRPLDAPRSAGRHRRIRRPGRSPARSLSQARAGVGNGRRRHQAAPRHRYAAPRYGRHRSGGDVRQRRRRPGRRAAVLPGLLCHRQTRRRRRANASSPASSRAACKRAARWWAARRPKCRACTTARTTILRDSASASWKKIASSTVRRPRAGDVVLGLPSSGPAFERLLADPQNSAGRAAPILRCAR